MATAPTRTGVRSREALARSPASGINRAVTVRRPLGPTLAAAPEWEASQSVSRSNEADYVLKTVEDRGIRFVRLWFTDVLGFLKSITITAQELEGAFADGLGFDGSAIEGFSRIQE